MVCLCTTLSFLHCVIGYTYVLIEKETIKSAKWNIVFYGRRCVCYILTLKIICTSRICISNHIMSNSKCDRALGLLYAPQGFHMCPWGSFIPSGALLCPRGLFYALGALVHAPPPPMHACPGTLIMPLGAHFCPLGLFLCPLGLIYAPWSSCAPPPIHACPPLPCTRH
jgi:hypothetical protein